MSRSKRIYILLGVLAAVCIAAFAISRIQEQKEKIKTTAETILALNNDEITGISWQVSSRSLSFTKDEVWQYDEDENFPVNEDKINDLLEHFESFNASFVIEDVEDYSQYGLSSPKYTITITADDEQYVITLGDYSAMDEQRYVSSGNGKVYLVEDDLSEVFDSTDLSDFIRNDKIPSLQKATQIDCAGETSVQIVMIEDSDDTCCEDDIYFMNSKPLDSSNVKSWLTTLSSVSLSDYINYNVSDDELEQYGLDDPEFTVSITLLDEDSEEDETFTIFFSRNKDALAAALAKEDEDAEDDVTVYARIKDSKIVYKIPSGTYQQVKAVTYNDLRHKEVLTAAFEDITQIDIELESEIYTFISRKDGSDTVWSYNDAETDLADFQEALESLEAQDTDSFTDDQPSGRKEIDVTVHTDIENFTEIEIGIYRNDGETCLAYVNGKPFAYISRSDVVTLIEKVNKLILS